MDSIRLLEIPCTDESSNLSPSTMFDTVDPADRDTRCMVSLSHYLPSRDSPLVPSLPAAADTSAVSVIEGCGCAEKSPVRIFKTRLFMSCVELQSCPVNDLIAC